jgi:altronate hydrolase
MKQSLVKVHPEDNVMVALRDLAKGERLTYDGEEYVPAEPIPAKHKFTTRSLEPGGEVHMYGVLVGRAKKPIPRGGLISTENLVHATDAYHLSQERKISWRPPRIDAWKDRSFMGYRRQNGTVGTANYWVIIPMVFCENRNVDVLQDALLEELGYARPKKYNRYTRKLVDMYRAGKTGPELLELEFAEDAVAGPGERLFPRVEGIKLLSHALGCGGTRQDAQALCGLLAGYITHPNVAGATVLSLGCQNAQVSLLREEISRRDPQFDKQLVVLEQQRLGTEGNLISEAVRQTFAGLALADQCRREPFPLSKLCIGLECGGSDGFSGISANPAIGYTSDLLVGLGGSVILSEFPELCGVEQELSDRCKEASTASRFMELMSTYQARATAIGSGFDMNPSPGNIRDGLITDAIKSAGAAKKGGTSPVADVLDYPEKLKKPGLNLLCTPGNDVESTTAEVGSGANIVLFTTGLGTPTGNPVAPVVKISSNTPLFRRMPDIIDLNAGTIIDGEESIQQCGERILDYVIQVASGDQTVSAVRHGQDDFIPWKRGVSL